MKLSVIVAVSADGVIGRDNSLPWRLPADLQRFKCLTLGHHLLMGRKTFESIGRALPGRTTVVITRRGDWSAEGVAVAHSVDDAVEIARSAGESEAFVAGGAEIYRQTLSRADRLYVTRIHAPFEGDTHFPELEESAWHVTSSEDREPDDRNPHPYTFTVYDRTRPPADGTG